MKNQFCKLFWRVLTGIVFLLLFQILLVEAQSSDKRISSDNPIILEINTFGKGMILANDKQNLFFRLYNDGTLEYDSKSETRTERKKILLKKKDFLSLKSLLKQNDFLKVNNFYDSIVKIKDAVLVVKIDYLVGKSLNTITIKNYMPSYPDSQKFYNPSLIKLLEKVKNLRPLTEFERKNNLGLELIE